MLRFAFFFFGGEEGKGSLDKNGSNVGIGWRRSRILVSCMESCNSSKELNIFSLKNCPNVIMQYVSSY